MLSRPPLRSLSLRPDDSLTIPRMALSIDFQDLVSFLLTIQATGPLTLALAGLTPAEYPALRWTYNHVHCFVSLDGIDGTLNGPKLLTGNNALVDETVILLDDVVQI